MTGTVSVEPTRHEDREHEEPEAINRRELMAYYGYRGIPGALKMYWRYFRNWFLQVLAKSSPHPGLTVVSQRMRGVKIGKHVYIGPGVIFDELYPQLATVEDYVSIGMGTMIFTHSNPTCSIDIKRDYYPRKVAPVLIKRGAWIPPGCIILCDVTIGENSVIGAGSVVIKNVEPYTLVAGNPAKLVKRLSPRERA